MKINLQRDFKEKAKLVNTFSAKQCILLSSNNTLNPKSTETNKQTNSLIQYICSSSDIAKAISHLDPNKP